MRYFKRAIFLAPALFTFRNAVTFSTVAVLMIPKSSCVEALPNGRKKDDDNNFFKKFTDKLPENVRSDVQELMGASATSLKSIFESGVPSQVRNANSLVQCISHSYENFIHILGWVWLYDGLF